MNRYTDIQLQFLRDGYPVMRVPELTVAFNAYFGTTKTRTAIKATLGNHKITCGRPTSGIPGNYLSYTQSQAQFIQENYVSLSIADLTTAFNVRFFENKTEAQIRCFTRNHRIKSGRTGCFEKGDLPWNTGTKGLTSANITSFKRGNVPANRKLLGTERICSKDGYIMVKVAERDPNTGFPTRYRPKHIILWEKRHGKVPPGMIVAFRDGNNENCDIENLMLISRAELLRLNQRHYKETPAELKPSILAVVKLETKARYRGKVI